MNIEANGKSQILTLHFKNSYGIHVHAYLVQCHRNSMRNVSASDYNYNKDNWTLSKPEMEQ